MDFIVAGLGLLILLFAGDALVRGAVNMALRLGIPALVVSLTVVAFGTSAPELLVSVQAVLDHAPGLAIGNVVGSNTANVLLVLGIPALIKTIHPSHCDTRKNYVMMIIATALFVGLAAGGGFGWSQGLILLGGLSVMIGLALRDAMVHRAQEKARGVEASAEDEEELEGLDPDMPWWRVIAFLIVGLIGLPVGADLLVESASSIARDYGVPEAVIGLTLVAIGTSLPELATSAMAALRGQADVALGNVIGSNMFNLLAIIGVASLVGPIPVPKHMLMQDFTVMMASSLLLAPFVFRGWTIGRLWGGIFVALYVAYIVSLIA